MKFLVFLFLTLSSSFHFTTIAQDVMHSNQENLIEEEVWQVVEKRNSTWKENDFNGHMAIYHPDFKRYFRLLLGR